MVDPPYHAGWMFLIGPNSTCTCSVRTHWVEVPHLFAVFFLLYRVTHLNPITPFNVFAIGHQATGTFVDPVTDLQRP